MLSFAIRHALAKIPAFALLLHMKLLKQIHLDTQKSAMVSHKSEM